MDKPDSTASYAHHLRRRADPAEGLDGVHAIGFIDMRNVNGPSSATPEISDDCSHGPQYYLEFHAMHLTISGRGLNGVSVADHLNSVGMAIQH